MPKYKITVEEIHEIEGEKYPDKKSIYEQTVEELDLKGVIATVNEMNIEQVINMEAPKFPVRFKKGGERE